MLRQGQAGTGAARQERQSLHGALRRGVVGRSGLRPDAIEIIPLAGLRPRQHCTRPAGDLRALAQVCELDAGVKLHCDGFAKCRVCKAPGCGEGPCNKKGMSWQSIPRSPSTPASSHTYTHARRCRATPTSGTPHSSHLPTARPLGAVLQPWSSWPAPGPRCPVGCQRPGR